MKGFAWTFALLGLGGAATFVAWWLQSDGWSWWSAGWCTGAGLASIPAVLHERSARNWQELYEEKWR